MVRIRRVEEGFVRIREGGEKVRKSLGPSACGSQKAMEGADNG